MFKHGASSACLFVVAVLTFMTMTGWLYNHILGKRSYEETAITAKTVNDKK